MSKSLNNFFTIRDVLTQYPPEVIRYFLASSHYRSAINYSSDNLGQASSALERLYNALKGIDSSSTPVAEDSVYESRFMVAMEDDFNTPEAISVLFDLAREVNRLKQESPESAAPLAGLLVQLAGILGFLQLPVEEFLKGGGENINAEEIDSLIEQRNQARAEKNWALADEIRDKLKSLNVVLEDKDGETSWRVER